VKKQKDAIESNKSRAILYARVSTDDQAEKGYSLPTQLDAMRQYAQANGFQVVRELCDDCSGAKLDRPALETLRGMLERKEADAVIVYAADRLGRNLAHLLILREEFNRAGVELHYCNRGKSQDTAESRLLENVEGVIAEYEREKIKERTRRGKIAKAKAGKWVGAGFVPYGFRKVGTKQDSRLEIDEYEARIVRRIFDMYVGQNGYEPTAMKRIARILTQEGVPTPKRGYKIGRGWWSHTIHSIIDRPTCLGIFQFGGVKIEMPELAIIDQETYDAAQKRRARNKELSDRNRKYPYLFTGYGKCTCGGKLCGNSLGAGKDKPRVHYYVCNRKKVYPDLVDCKERFIRVEVFEGLVWEWLVSLLTDDTKLEKGIREYINSRESELTKARERAAMIDEMIARADTRIARLAGDLRDLESESARAAIKRDMDAIGKEKDSLIAEREKISAGIGKREITEADCDYIRETARLIREKLNGKPTYQEKRALFDAIGLTIQLQHDEKGRALFVTCGLAMQGEALSLKGKKPRDYLSTHNGNNTDYPIVPSSPTFWETQSFRARGRVCTATRQCARCQAQNRSAARNRTCASRDTIRTARAANCVSPTALPNIPNCHCAVPRR
jgi:site-specific DNA recombinase